MFLYKTQSWSSNTYDVLKAYVYRQRFYSITVILTKYVKSYYWVKLFYEQILHDFIKYSYPYI